MTRVMVNGVIWSSAEDDVVKAGVLRYGVNHWEKILQLLPGKTVQDCIDRWESGLKESFRRSRFVHLRPEVRKKHESAEEVEIDPAKVVPGRVYRNPNGNSDSKDPINETTKLLLDVRAKLSKLQARKVRGAGRRRRRRRRLSYMRKEPERVIQERRKYGESKSDEIFLLDDVSEFDGSSKRT